MDRILQRFARTCFGRYTCPRTQSWPVSLRAARYVYALVRDLATGELSLRAMSLVYTTMLAIVPLLAFMFSVAKGLGFHRELQPVLLRFLEPIGPRAEEITSNVVNFVDNLSSGTLAAISIALLLYTALSMAQKVESSFNFVWRVDRPRSLTQRFSEYLSVMFVGPLLMVISNVLIAALSNALVLERLAEIGPFGSWLAVLGSMLPYALVIGAFTFLYLFIPNTKVHLRPALIGGLFAGIAWAASGYFFTSIVAGSTRLEAIYSGFAIVIVLMFWLYVSWFILLLGSQLAYYLQNPYQLRMGRRIESVANDLRERLAINTMLLVGRDFANPDHGWSTASLAAKLRVPKGSLEPVIGALMHAQLLAETADGKMIPARDPRGIAVTDIVAAVRRGARTRVTDGSEDWNKTVDSVANRINDAIEQSLAGRTLADLVDYDVRNSQTVGEHKLSPGPAD